MSEGTINLLLPLCQSTKTYYTYFPLKDDRLANGNPKHTRMLLTHKLMCNTFFGGDITFSRMKTFKRSEFDSTPKEPKIKRKYNIFFTVIWFLHKQKHTTTR